jgi:hypothetical protein
VAKFFVRNIIITIAIKHDDEEIPTALRSYRYDTNNNNPTETFDRKTQQVAQFVATDVQGADYMRRALINLQESTIQPPPKPTGPREPENEADDCEKTLYEMEKAHYDADLEVWKEEVKLVPRRRDGTMQWKTGVDEKKAGLDGRGLGMYFETANEGIDENEDGDIDDQQHG